MKNWKVFVFMALIAVIGFAVVGCKGKDEPVHVHQWGDWTVTKEPTTTEEGEETRTCPTCGEKETRPIDKLEEQIIDTTYELI